MCFFNYHGNIITFSTNLKNRNNCITTVQSFWYIFFVFCFFFVLTTCLLVHRDTDALQEGGGGDITIHPKFSGRVQLEFLCAIALPASSALFPGCHLVLLWDSGLLSPFRKCSLTSLSPPFLAWRLSPHVPPYFPTPWHWLCWSTTPLSWRTAWFLKIYWFFQYFAKHLWVARFSKKKCLQP